MAKKILPIENKEPPDDYEEDGEAITIAATEVPGSSRITISNDQIDLYQKMERYAQELAIHSARYFKNGNLEDRKKLILKSIEVLKLNPPPWYEKHPERPL